MGGELEILFVALALLSSLQLTSASSYDSYEFPPGGSCSETSICFAAPAGEGGVLQRAPAKAAIYGSIPKDILLASGVGTINLTMTEAGVASGGPLRESHEVALNGDNTWKVVLSRSYPAGGNYSITVSCAKGCKPTREEDSDTTTTATINDLTFGDVFVCAGVRR